jgi:hypothetical protein
VPDLLDGVHESSAARLAVRDHHAHDYQEDEDEMFRDDKVDAAATEPG